MGRTTWSSFVTCQYFAMDLVAPLGRDEPRVLLITDVMPPEKTSIFFLVLQLFGCSGSEELIDMIVRVLSWTRSGALVFPFCIGCSVGTSFDETLCFGDGELLWSLCGNQLDGCHKRTYAKTNLET